MTWQIVRFSFEKKKSIFMQKLWLHKMLMSSSNTYKSLFIQKFYLRNVQRISHCPDQSSSLTSESMKFSKSYSLIIPYFLLPDNVNRLQQLRPRDAAERAELRVRDLQHFPSGLQTKDHQKSSQYPVHR